jgi:hypothetical protein
MVVVVVDVVVVDVVDVDVVGIVVVDVAAAVVLLGSVVGAAASSVLDEQPARASNATRTAARMRSTAQS